LILDNVTRSILLHLFRNKKINVQLFSAAEKKKCSSILKPLDCSLEDFFQKSKFSEEEQGNLLYELLKLNIDILAIGQLLDWKKFEIFISTIFNRENYSVLTNFRFKDEITKYETDVISFKFPYIFVIDCKYYKNMSLSVLENAVEKQKERVEALFEIFPIISNELISKLQLPLKRRLFLFPVIISWRDHQIQFLQNVPIIPYKQLSGFLQEIDENREKMFYLNILLD